MSSHNLVLLFSVLLNIPLFLSSQIIPKATTMVLKVMDHFLLYILVLHKCLQRSTILEKLWFHFSTVKIFIHKRFVKEQWIKRWSKSCDWFLHSTHQFGLIFQVGSLFWSLSAMFIHSWIKVKWNFKTYIFFFWNIGFLESFVSGWTEFQMLQSKSSRGEPFLTVKMSNFPFVLSFQMGISSSLLGFGAMKVAFMLSQICT